MYKKINESYVVQPPVSGAIVQVFFVGASKVQPQLLSRFKYVLVKKRILQGNIFSSRSYPNKILVKDIRKTARK